MIPTDRNNRGVYPLHPKVAKTVNLISDTHSLEGGVLDQIEENMQFQHRISRTPKLELRVT